VTPKLLTSRLLSHVPHAFSTREGGVSCGIFASLSFGNPMELVGDQRDPPAHIAQNWALLRSAIGAEHRRVAQVHQVHGCEVVTLREGDDPAPEPSRKADAIVTMVGGPTGLLASVRVADCAPVLIASRDGRVVGAVHAGWRGVVLGVVPSAIQAIRRLHPEARLVAAIGPCISMPSFEVGPEVIAEFEKVFGVETRHVRRHEGGGEGAGKGHADIPGAIVEQLRGSGVEDVEVLEGCTMLDPARFFSHRGQKGMTGRMVGVIGPA
jgi:YfiH family protein